MIWWWLLSIGDSQHDNYFNISQRSVAKNNSTISGLDTACVLIEPTAAAKKDYF